MFESYFKEWIDLEKQSMAFITCNNLELGYKDQLVATGINFKVEKGDYIYSYENAAKTYETCVGRDYLR